MNPIASNSAARSRDLSWFIVSRRHEYMGEGHAAILRVVSAAVYYAVHCLVYFSQAQHSAEEIRLHRGDTILAAAWVFLSLAVYLALERRYFPPALKYFVTAIDLALLTGLLALHGGPTSSLVAIYFPLIASAGIRLSLGLVRFTTIGAMLGYLALVGSVDRTWFSSDHVVPVSVQLTMHVSFFLTGLFVGRIVRNVRILAHEFIDSQPGDVA